MFTGLKKILPAISADGRFREHYKSYIFQSALIFLSISAILLLYEFLGGIIVASLGASGFIFFSAPHKNGSRLRYALGGYICGAVSGVLASYVHAGIFGASLAGVHYSLAIAGASAVALTSLLMMALNLEHPPAAALALGLTFNPNCLKTALAAIAGVVLLNTLKHVLKSRLKNLD